MNSEATNPTTAPPSRAHVTRSPDEAGLMCPRTPAPLPDVTPQA